MGLAADLIKAHTVIAALPFVFSLYIQYTPRGECILSMCPCVYVYACVYVYVALLVLHLREKCIDAGFAARGQVVLA